MSSKLKILNIGIEAILLKKLCFVFLVKLVLEFFLEIIKNSDTTIGPHKTDRTTHAERTI